MVFEPAAQFFGRPVGLIGERRVINDRQHLCLDLVMSENPGTACTRSVDQTVNPALVETGYPKPKRSFTGAAIANHQFIGNANHEQMHRIEPTETLVIGAAIHCQLQLFKGAILSIGELVRTRERSPMTGARNSTSDHFEFRQKILAKGLHPCAEPARRGDTQPAGCVDGGSVRGSGKQPAEGEFGQALGTWWSQLSDSNR